ncbi:MAG: hypothetical protein JWO22_3921 [Frankiales bacterium]|nr:hypothetical protein [Frankiales bacterium]
MVPVRTGAAYVLVLVLTVELALAEAVLTATRPFGHPLPVAALVAAVANPLLTWAGGRITGRTAGAVVPGVLWLALVMVLGSKRPEGDLIVLGNGRGFGLIAVGALAAVIGAVVGTTPRGSTSR